MTEKEGNIDEDCLFVELRPEEVSTLPRLVEVYVAQIEPKICRTLLKVLSQDLPLATTPEDNRAAGTLFDLSHLKRVKKVVNKGNNSTKEEDSQKSPSKKKQKQEDNNKAATDDDKKKDNQSTPHLLEVLLRDVESLEGDFGAQMMKQQSSHERSSITDFLKTKYELSNIVQRKVPGRPPDSHQEWQDFQNEYWPTIFFPQRSKEHLDQQIQLSTEEIRQMVVGMEQAIQDKKQHASTSAASSGAVMVDPATGKVVARATEERKLQHSDNSNSQHKNPLATPILWAIQGVSRLERTKALSSGSMTNGEFQKGQYLCTGYDLYTTKEPTVFEAMSLVHSRIRRVVFGQSHEAGCIRSLHIHALPSTNHHYRAFQCRPGSELRKQCQCNQR